MRRRTEIAWDVLSGSFRTDVNGWLRVHLEGSPGEVGFQHGYRLAREIQKTILMARGYVRTLGRDWRFFRKAALAMYRDRSTDEYIEEMQGIAKGVKRAGVRQIDQTDIIALNGLFDTLSYDGWMRYKSKKSPAPIRAGHCSAFAATGSATTGGELIMGHNMWLDYGMAAWNVIMSIRPKRGNRILMQTLPGSIQGCGVDVYVNSAGLMVTNTTLSGVKTFNQEGAPYFVRARKAIQYAKSIDEWIEIFLKNNNGGDASGWLLGDSKTREAAYVEVAAQNHSVRRTRDGFFMGCNLAYDQKVREETGLDYEDSTSSSATRSARWQQLLESRRGTIDVESAKQFLADHYDVSLGEEKPTRGTLCGHVELDGMGLPEWGCGAYYPFGATDGIVMASELATRGAFWAHWGKPCGTDFIANEYFRIHPEYAHLRASMRDILAYPWSLFSGAW